MGLTAQDTPDPRDVLKGHQVVRGVCTCGATPHGAVAMADHQLAVLYASGLAVVSVHGTAGVVQAAAGVVGAFRAAGAVHMHAEREGEPLRAALLHLVERVEAMAG